MANVLEVTDIHKKLGSSQIIKGISFSVKEGEIFGFLGPNGAGKTTTIKMIVGLLYPNKGTIKINNYDVQAEREKALSSVGAVVENPELYLYLTGRQNLEQVASFYDNITKDDIENIGNLVGLKGRLDDKVKKYSLGMKQRLGLASSLLSKPKLLILDEPTNGLDPSGIIEFRNILKRTAKETNTGIFVSSHILSEIEQLCDTVAFIKSGVIESIESLNKSTINDSKTENFEEFIIKTTEKDKCSESLKNISYISDFKLQSETESPSSFVVKAKAGSIPDIVIDLAKKNIRIEEIYKKHQQLEDRYMELVKGVNK
ncbi:MULTISPECIES: ABC transporter ATP-binding protein [Clostridium]|uniref:ABC transporter ATP-binding protein n=1 Tax=Clostridium TaxID=1485 RepID=UPI00069F7E6B|nr:MULTISPECIES: ABC transporter ATP-binding protein [Clostridium]KOF55708.1 bacitracin ABC transporter ATP-binding protein [Clostridium sp. DMHC 10]MCD2348997.1 ABC transporter ATP-binding protein [Clostridium guangxiense]